MHCIQHCFICRPSDSTVSKGSNPGLLRLRSEVYSMVDTKHIHALRIVQALHSRNSDAPLVIYRIIEDDLPQRQHLKWNKFFRGTSHC
jgi:hypothetical protein